MSVSPHLTGQVSVSSPLRSDAEENRARIVEAARAAVTSTPELRLNAVAKAAGVGQGTLYRHFPTREDLLAEVYRVDVDALVEAAPSLLSRHSPEVALALWFERVADYAAVKRGVFAAVEKALWQDLAAHSLGPIGAALTLLLDAGKAAGVIRDDVDARDVILLIGYLSRLDASDTETRARHLLTVILDGLKAGAGSSAPVSSRPSRPATGSRRRSSAGGTTGHG